MISGIIRYVIKSDRELVFEHEGTGIHHGGLVDKSKGGSEMRYPTMQQVDTEGNEAGQRITFGPASDVARHFQCKPFVKPGGSSSVPD